MPAGSRLRGQHCRRPVSCRAAFFFQRPRPAGSNPRARYFFLESFANSNPFFEPFHLHELQPLASLRHRRLEVSPPRRRVERRLRHAAIVGKLRDCEVRLRSWRVSPAGNAASSMARLTSRPASRRSLFRTGTRTAGTARTPNPGPSKPPNAFAMPRLRASRLPAPRPHKRRML